MDLGISMDLLPAANNLMPPAVLQAWNKTGCDCNCICVQEIAIAMMVDLFYLRGKMCSICSGCKWASPASTH